MGDYVPENSPSFLRKQESSDYPPETTKTLDSRLRGNDENRQKPISAIAKRVSSGLTPLRSNPEFWQNGTIPWLKTEQLGEKYIYSTTEKISETALEKTSIKVYPANTITIAMYGEGATRGNVSIIKKEMATNQACCNVEIDPELADVEYVYYFLKTQYNALRNLSSGVRKNLNSEDIKSFIIRFPEHSDEQQKIASVLSFLDAKIDLNHRINAELEALAKTIYDYWFVQFDFPDAHGRPYRSSGGAMVWNDTLKREIPAGWGAEPLSAWIAKKKNGEWGANSGTDDNGVQVTCIRGADIDALNGRGELHAPTRYIPTSKAEKYLTPYDLVVEISGGSPKQSTGRVALVSSEVIERFDVPLVCSNFCKALTLKDTSRSYIFLQQWNALYNAGAFFGWEGKTSGIKNLQFDAFVNHYHASVPPDGLSRRFQEFCCSIDQRKQSGLSENAELTRLRDWLLPLLMNGQVRVAGGAPQAGKSAGVIESV